MRNTNKAFTLAEVLITLGIIGVVAALTIPTLIAKYNMKTAETQVKQTYSILQQIIKYSEVNDMVFSPAPYIGNSDTSRPYRIEYNRNWIDNYVSKYLKVTQRCEREPGCWHREGVVKDLLGNAPVFEHDGYIGVGDAFVDIQGRYYDIDDSASTTIATNFGVNVNVGAMEIFFDINGAKKPNVIGKDIYIVIWTDRGLLPAGYDKTKQEIENNCLNGNGYFCLAYLMQNRWEIDERVWNR